MLDHSDHLALIRQDGLYSHADCVGQGCICPGRHRSWIGILPVRCVNRPPSCLLPGVLSFFRWQGVKLVMKSRLDLAVEKGCDGVEPDAVEVLNHVSFCFCEACREGLVFDSGRRQITPS